MPQQNKNSPNRNTNVTMIQTVNGCSERSTQEKAAHHGARLDSVNHKAPQNGCSENPVDRGHGPTSETAPFDRNGHDVKNEVCNREVTPSRASHGQDDA